METVAAVLQDANGDFIPDRLGGRVSVRGVLTSEPIATSRTTALANFQDETGGLLLFTRAPSRFEGFKAGDEVVATGDIEQYQGAEQLNVKNIELVREGMMPVPALVTTKELASETNSGRLVRVKGRVTVLDSRDGDNVRALLKDGEGEINLFIPSRFYGEPAFVRELMSNSKAEVVGIASQLDTKPPFDEGYRIVPRTTADFVFYPDPPYRAILVTLSVGLLLLASLMLWRSRKEAEKATQEMKVLTEELKVSEAQLRENQNRLRLLTEQVPAIVWSVDKNLRFTSSTGAGLKSLNLKPDEVLGMTLFEYFQSDDIKFPPIAAHRRAISGRSSTFQSRWSERMYECHIEPLRSSSGEIVGALGLALDITARSHAEHELKEQSEVLRHSQKMEAVGRLAGGVAHDFNNLVTVIKGYCDLISLKLGPDHDLQDWFEEIKNSAARAASLTGQLLAFSRKQVLEPRVLDLNSVLSDMNRLLRRIIGEHIELVTDLDPGLGAVRVDKGQIEQVIMNLAVNAYDAMPKGGQLALRTKNVLVTGAEHGALGQLPEGPYAMISFSDTGEGISEEIRTRIFEPFFTTKEVGKGTGLGLATVYGIVTQSGGTIDLESRSGEGTTFRIYLPVVPEAVSSEPVRVIPSGDIRGDETILVAEDEPAVRSLIRRTLEEKGYCVLEAENGSDALDLADAHVGGIDLLVTDVVMPRMSGFKLAQLLHKKRPETKVLYVSGYAYTGRHEGEKISPETFLAKPFSPEMLTLKIHRLLNDPASVHHS